MLIYFTYLIYDIYLNYNYSFPNWYKRKDGNSIVTANTENITNVDMDG